MKAIAELDEDFARFEKVCAAESEAIVKQHAAIGDVDGLQVDGKALAELLAEREVKRSVRLKMIGGNHRRLIAVGEAGGVRDIRGGRNTPRERELAADVERVALMVAQQALSATPTTPVSESDTADNAFAAAYLRWNATWTTA